MGAVRLVEADPVPRGPEAEQGGGPGEVDEVDVIGPEGARDRVEEPGGIDIAKVAEVPVRSRMRRTAAPGAVEHQQLQPPGPGGDGTQGVEPSRIEGVRTGHDAHRSHSPAGHGVTGGTLGGGPARPVATLVA